ncbi:MAG: glycine cleavage system protein GcvH [Acidimicrobiia bacterium]
MEFPEDLRYTEEHEWVKVEDGRCRVGITDYAQDALGDIVFVQLPEVGIEVVAKASCCEVESTKSVSEIYAPVSGSIAEVNDSLADEPERVNDEPYGAGWMFLIEMVEPDEVGTLLDVTGYRALVEQE